jgi:putative phage-type endonuclease
MNYSSYDLDVICLRNNLNNRKICKECKNDEHLVSCLKSRLEQLKENKKLLKKLLKIPKIEQKSQEWYLVRQGLLTASDFAQALGQGKFGNQTDIIKKKVRPSDESSASFSNPFFKWGNMFEQVASDIYSKMHYDVKLYEFGLVQHKTLSYFGASPDGITETGIMLEIKCPYKRKIEFGAEVPKQYYYQIQGQLEVCGLNECDYFECQFHLFTTIDEFYNSFSDDRIKGIIIELPSVSGGSYYEYSPIIMGKKGDVSIDDFKNWVDNNTNEEFIDIKIWYLHTYNLKRVSLDKQFVDDNLKELKIVWDKILYYRENPERYNIEVLKTINIGDVCNNSSKQDTKIDVAVKQSKTKTIGYSFITDPHE